MAERRVKKAPLAIGAALLLSACGGDGPTGPGAPVKLAFTIQPGTVTAGAAMSPAVQVTVQDAQGNTVTSSRDSITLAITTGTGASGAVLSGTRTRAATSGVVAFTGLTIDKAGTGYTLTATATGLSSATSASFPVNAGAASTLIFAVQPGSVTAGAAISPAVQVTAQDALGNTATSSTANITLAITSGTGTGGAVLGGTLTRAAASGVATFADLTVDKAGTGYTLTATATGLTSATSASFPVNAGAASRLVFAIQPSVATVGARISPAVQVAVQDALGNTVTSSTASITLAITSGTGTSGAVLGGTLNRAAVAGVASFGDLTIDRAGTGYTLTATATDLTSATSTSFTTTACTLQSPGDADGDRLPDCVETNTRVFVSSLNTGTDPSSADTDGDAILDGDEVLGTTLGLDLPLMGANPLRRDVLLEYDWFDDALDCDAHTHRPSASAVAMVTAAFANAPVLNADGSTGINVISDYGQGGVFTGGNLIGDADGVLTEGVNGPEFLSHKTANHEANRAGYFHYVLLPHRYNVSSSSSGQAEVIGDDLIVSLYCAGSDRNVAHTIMHELGHNLGLRHGGFENTNYKPNYNSVMNYRYQFPGIDNNCTPPGDGVLGFSVGTRPQLNEASLDETRGVCGNPPGPGWDWNGDGDALDVGIALDINVDGAGAGDGVLGVLFDYNDWGFLLFNGLSDADGAFVVAREIITCTNPAPRQER